MEYERDPAVIYAKSFAMIESEVDLTGLPVDMRRVARRMIHASGMVDVLDDLRYDAQVVPAVVEALDGGGSILVDVRMVAMALGHACRNRNNALICLVDDGRVVSAAAQERVTRAAVSVRFWQEDLAGSVVVIGSAPTALFALLERMETTGIVPAAIIGMPVGFIGAIESKNALVAWAGARGVPFMTLLGRRGGSALAGAALNGIMEAGG